MEPLRPARRHRSGAGVRPSAWGVIAVAGPLERFSQLSCEVLLVGGSRRGLRLTTSPEGLELLLPSARKVALRGAGHTAPHEQRQILRDAPKYQRSGTMVTPPRPMCRPPPAAGDTSGEAESP